VLDAPAPRRGALPTASPRYFEVPFGGRGSSRFPGRRRERGSVEIPLPGREALPLRGSIDGWTRRSDGTFHVWDYKTERFGEPEGGGCAEGARSSPSCTPRRSRRFSPARARPAASRLPATFSRLEG
jgi:hypothetical protein